MSKTIKISVESHYKGRGIKEVTKDIEKLEKASKQTTKSIEQDSKKASQSLKSNFLTTLKEIRTEFKKGFSEGISGSTSKATKDVDGLKNSTSKFNKVAGVATVVAGALAATIGSLAVASIGSAKVISRLSASFADYTNKIRKTREATGLSTNAISALNFEAKKTKISFDVIESGLTSFTKKIGQAERGSKSATAQLSALGINSKEAANNIDAAFSKALASINKLPPGVQKSNAAMDLFGDAGAKLLPFIADFKGDLSGLIKTAEKYGYVIGEDSVNASKEFSNATADMQLQVEGLKLELGREFLPVVTDVFKSLNQLIRDNRSEMSAWARGLADTMVGAKNIWFDYFDSTAKLLGKWILNTNGFFVAGRMIGGAARRSGQSSRSLANQNAQNQDEFVNSYTPFNQSSGQSYLNRSTPLSSRKLSSGRRSSGKDVFKLSSRARALIEASNDLGVSPLDLASIISFESAGSFNPYKKGPTTKWGTHRGLIQFGEPQAEKYGVHKGQSFENQITTSVVKYLKDAFAKAGMTTGGANLVQLYAAILGGDPRKQNTADKFGTTARNAIGKISGEHRTNALNTFFGGSASNVPGSQGFDLLASNKELSSTLTEAKENERIDKIIALYEKLGLLPGKSMIARFRKRFDAEAEKAGTAKLTDTEIFNKFVNNKNNLAVSGGLVDATPGKLGTSVGSRETINNFTLDRMKRLAPAMFLRLFDETYQQTKEEVLSRLGDTKEGNRLAEIEAREAAAKRINGLEDEYVQSVKESLNLEQRRLEINFRDANYQTIQNALVAERLVSQEEELGYLAEQLEIQRKLFGNNTYKDNERANSILRDKVALERESFDLKARLTAGGANNALEIEVSHLRDLVDLRQREVDAIKSKNRSLLELSQKGNYSKNQSDAQVLEYLNNNVQSLTDIFANAKIDTIDAFWGTIDKGIAKVTSKLGIFKDMVGNLMSSLAKLFTSKLLQKFLGLGSGGGGGFNLGSIFGGGSGGGFNLGSLTGGFGGGASPAARLLGLGGIGAGSVGTAWAAGSGGAALAGATSAAGGAWGAAGLGSGAAGGLGSFGALAGFMTNPITLGILGAAVGGFALFKLFNRGKSIKRLKKASMSEFGIDVQDKSVLKQMKKVSEATIGKVSSNEKAIEAVNVPENKELLQIHAEATGQDTSRLNRDRISDENFEGNQFRSNFAGFREFGGSVRAGMSYIVGEKRPELFTPSQNGVISPSVPSSNGVDSRLLSEIVRVLDSLSVTVGRLQAVSPDSVVAMGADGASEQIANANEKEFANNPERSFNLVRNVGL